MDKIIFIKDLFESIPNSRKIVFSIFLFQNDKGLLGENGFSKRDIVCLPLEFKKILLRHHEKYLDYVKSEEDSIIERFFEKKNPTILRYYFRS